MRARVRCLLLFILFFIIGMMNASARPSNAAADNSDLADRQSTGSFTSTPARVSMLLVGGGLVVFGGILRRRLRT